MPQIQQQSKTQKWIRSLALEAERAITQLPTFEEEHTDFQLAHNIRHSVEQHENNNIYNNIPEVKEKKVIKQIKEKLKIMVLRFLKLTKAIIL